MHRKVGDLGNLLVNASTGRGYYAERGNRLITLRGETSVVGRTLILHAQPDNCAAEEGPGGDLSAEARIGMCVIGISEEHDHVRQHDIRMHYTSLFSQNVSAAPVSNERVDARQRSSATEYRSDNLIGVGGWLLALMAGLTGWVGRGRVDRSKPHASYKGITQSEEE